MYCIYSHSVTAERKFDEKGEKYFFIGNGDESEGYSLLNPRTIGLMIYRDDIFDETKMWSWEINGSAAPIVLE